MKVLLIRHGRAADRAEFAVTGHADDLRPLSADGRRDMRRVAPAIADRIRALSILAASPLARAFESAALVARAVGKVQPEELPALAPGGDPAAIIRWLGRHPVDVTVGLVGHEPSLGTLASLLLCGVAIPFLRLKHGGACLLQFNGKPQTGRGRLSWLMTPRQLRLLSD